jgi:hypothetical protein
MMRSARALAYLGLLSMPLLPVSAQRNNQRLAHAALVGKIEEMFVNQVVKQMALTPAELPRFRKVALAWADKRGGLEAQERDLRAALNEQMRPGVAAVADSVGKLVAALNDNRVAYAESFRDEMHELTPILSPVQLGQYQIVRDRFLQRIKDIQQQRPQAPVGGPSL